MRPPSFAYLLLLMGGGMVLIMPVAFRSKQYPYPAHFAARAELRDLRHKSWSSRRLRYALLIGFYLPLPEQEPMRAETLRGHLMARLDKYILALPKGYGGREELGHIAVFGATRSGKSIHLMTQAVTWQGTFICLDIKGELYAQTAGLRAQMGRVYYLSPDGIGHRFDAISEMLKSPNGDLAAGKIITEPHKEKELIFANRAALGLAAIFGTAKRRGIAPLEYAREIVVDGGLAAFITQVAEYGDDEVRRRAAGFLGMTNLDPTLPVEAKVAAAGFNKFLTSAWDNMSLKLNVFLSEPVLWTFSGSDFSPGELLRAPASIYLGFPETTLEATSAVYNMLVAGLIMSMARHVDEARKVYGHRWSPSIPVLVGLAEAARAPISDLADILSTAAGRNISVMLYLQSPSQFDDLYGPDATEAILTNCGVQLFYKIESLKTAKYIEERCHRVSVETRSTSRTINRWFKPVSRSESSTPREVFTREEALALGGKNRQIILAFVTGQRPFIAKRMNYFEQEIGNLMGLYPAPPVPEMGELTARTPRVPVPAARPETQEELADTDEPNELLTA